MDSNIIEIYCDGSCLGNPGKGGWGIVLVWKENIKTFSGFETNTTNNRMELKAVIEALKLIKDASKNINIYVDSMYVKNGITTWINSWLKTDWKKGKIKNIDLWQELYNTANNFQIEWHWVKAHNGNKYNEMADKLAFESAKNCNI